MKNEIFQTCLNALGFESFNEMQQNCINTFETNKYVRLQSPTGSGKTLAFLASSLHNLTPGIPFQMMILAPSRELAIQIADVWKSMQTGMQAVCCYGGHDKKIESNRLKSGPEVV
ncbi:MAG: DEAD/DEAH box helicase, partial [Flavobacteriales bacterium]